MKVLHIFLTTLFFYSTSQAQELTYNNTVTSVSDPVSVTEVIKGQKVQRGMLKGPKAKNHPDWQYRASKVLVSQPETLNRVTGPKAKNSQPWRDSAEQELVPVMRKQKPSLKGPKAKNYKPFQN